MVDPLVALQELGYRISPQEIDGMKQHFPPDSIIRAFSMTLDRVRNYPLDSFNAAPKYAAGILWNERRAAEKVEADVQVSVEYDGGYQAGWNDAMEHVSSNLKRYMNADEA